MASPEKSSQREKQSSGLGVEEPACGDEVKRDDEGGSLGWQSILAAIAGAAGGAAWVSAVGSAVMGARLDNAGLPVESVVSLMPTEQRFAIGVGHLLAPLFVGLLGFLADLALTAHWSRSKRAHPDREARARPWKRALLAAATIVVGAWIGDVLLEPPSLTLYMLQLAVLIVAVAAVWWFGENDGESPRERGVVFLLVLVLAGVIAFGFEVQANARFDFAAVRFQDAGQAPLAGYYVTTSSAAVLLITLGDEADPTRCPRTTALRRISALPVRDIDVVWIGPREKRFDTDVYCDQKKIALTTVVR
jgi:hypothetical protein